LRALVTGGRGFIGSFLVEKLLQKGLQVRCLLRRKPNDGWLEGLPFEHYEGDVTEPETLTAAVSDVHYVYHLAGLTRAVSTKDYIDVNTTGTRNLLEALQNANAHLQRFVLVSSLAAGGPSPDGRPIKENDLYEPVSIYGNSKREAERITTSYAESFPISIVRPPTVFGPRDTDVFEFFKYVRQGWRPDMTGGPRQASLVYVMDLVVAIIMAAEKNQAIGQTYYICYDAPVYWNNLIAAISNIMECKKPFVFKIPMPLAYMVATAAEIYQKVTGNASLISLDKFQELKQKNWICDNSKAKSELDFEPTLPLAEALQATYSWYRQAGWL